MTLSIAPYATTKVIKRYNKYLLDNWQNKLFSLLYSEVTARVPINTSAKSLRKKISKYILRNVIHSLKLNSMHID